MLFLRREGVELTWALLTPLIERLDDITDPRSFPNYGAGSQGPEAAKRLIERDGRSWLPLGPEIADVRTEIVPSKQRRQGTSRYGIGG